ncbi:MAG TPA: GNAT family N-acetyltransferase [Steroidobacteraceae bacterium]
MTIEPTNPTSADARALIAMADQYLASLYPAASNHLDDVEVLTAPKVLFLGCLVGAALVGCGAVKILADDGEYGEIKRVFVLPAHRGRGYSVALMERLESHLQESGIWMARLETGISQPEALAMYRRLGYVERGPFGAYIEDPLSIFMEKRLAGS